MPTGYPDNPTSVFPWERLYHSIMLGERNLLRRDGMAMQEPLHLRASFLAQKVHLLPRLEDVLCLFISSAMPDDLLPTDFVLEPGHPSFLTTGLKCRSVLRMHKLALLHKVLVLRVWGEGDPPLMSAVNQRLRLALGL